MPSTETTAGSARPGRTEGGVTGVEIAWRVLTPLAGVSRWRCLERAQGATVERRQLWRVIAFVHAGAYGVSGPRGRGLVDPLHVAFFGPGEPYTTAHPCGVGDHGSALVLREDLFDDLLRSRFPEAADDPRRLGPTGPCPTPVLLRHRTLLSQVESDASDLAVEEEAIGIVDALLAAAAAGRREGTAGVRRAHLDLAAWVRELLGREFRQPLRLETIATRMEVTPAHLCRVFRRATGWSIHRYVTHLRLRAALESLASGEDDLSGLACDLGFSSHSHFTFAFRCEFGVPPSAWRGPRPAPRARFR
jgi:AraC-like DNA-binding protein